MIKFNWKRQSDGKPLAKVSVQHVLTRGKAAGLLITYLSPAEKEDLRDYSKAFIELCIRSQLKANPSVDGWSDGYIDCELDIDQVWAWAQRQVAKL